MLLLFDIIITASSCTVPYNLTSEAQRALGWEFPLARLGQFPLFPLGDSVFKHLSSRFNMDANGPGGPVSRFLSPMAQRTLDAYKSGSKPLSDVEHVKKEDAQEKAPSKRPLDEFSDESSDDDEATAHRHRRQAKAVAKNPVKLDDPSLLSSDSDDSDFDDPAAGVDSDDDDSSSSSSLSSIDSLDAAESDDEKQSDDEPPKSKSSSSSSACRFIDNEAADDDSDDMHEVVHLKPWPTKLAKLVFSESDDEAEEASDDDEDDDDDDDESSDDENIVRDDASRKLDTIQQMLGIRASEIKPLHRPSAAEHSAAMIKAATSHLVTVGVDVNGENGAAPDSVIIRARIGPIKKRLAKMGENMRKTKDAEELESRRIQYEDLAAELQQAKAALAAAEKREAMSAPTNPDDTPSAIDPVESPCFTLVNDTLRLMSINHPELPSIMTELYTDVLKVVLQSYSMTGKNPTNYHAIIVKTVWDRTRPVYSFLCHLFESLCYRKSKCVSASFIQAVHAAWRSQSLMQIKAQTANVPLGAERLYRCCTCDAEQVPFPKQNSLTHTVPIVRFVQHKSMPSSAPAVQTFSALESEGQCDAASQHFVMCNTCASIQLPLFNLLLSMPDQIALVVMQWIQCHRTVVNQPNKQLSTLVNAFHTWEPRKEHQKAVERALIASRVMYLK